MVDDVSGRMNVECEVVIHMAGEDHRSIARYEAVTSPSYEKVLGKLKEAVYATTNRKFSIPILAGIDRKGLTVSASRIENNRRGRWS